jgi:hypothetical protein
VTVRPHATLLALLACVLHAGAVRAEFVFDASGSYTYDDNVSNGLDTEDRKADQVLNASLTAGLYQQLGASTGATLALVAEQNSYLRYSGLTNLAGGASARLRHKFGLGGDAPWIAASGLALYRNYHYDYRDGWQYDAALTVGKPLSPRFSVQGSVRYDKFSADHVQPTVLPGISTAAYDTSGTTWSARLTYGVTQADVLSAGYAYRNGSVTAVTHPDYEILEYSDAVARDPVFHMSPFGVAYRLDGKTDVWTLGWTHGFGGHLALTAAYTYQRTDTVRDLDPYYANVFSLTLGYSR